MLPWPLYVESQFPGYLRGNFFNEQLGHIFDTHFPRDSEPTPLGLLWAQHLVWWFPWVLFLPAAVMSRLSQAGESSARSEHPLARLPLVWFLAIAVAASLTGQRQDYHTEEGEVVRRWGSGEPVWLITEGNRLELWRGRFGGDSSTVVARSGTRVLLANRAARARG